MTTPDLAANASQNLVSTYFELGGATPGARVVKEAGFRACMSDLPHPICNFAADLSLDPWSGRALARLASSRPCFHVYALSTDRPPELGEILSRSGFRLNYRLSQMAAEPSPGEGVDLEPAATLAERLEVGGFMVEQFFSRQTPLFRRRVAEATARAGGLEILCLRRSGRLAGAAMLSRSGGVLGIYNLCVASSLRGKGLGGGILASLLQTARREGLPATLQCEPTLEGWYAHRGFKRIGDVQVQSLSKTQVTDIMSG